MSMPLGCTTKPFNRIGVKPSLYEYEAFTVVRDGARWFMWEQVGEERVSWGSFRTMIDAAAFFRVEFPEYNVTPWSQSSYRASR